MNRSWTNEYVKVVRHYTPGDKPDNWVACTGSAKQSAEPHTVGLGNYGHGPWARHSTTRDERYVTCEACLDRTPSEVARRERDAARGQLAVTELLQLGALAASYEDRRHGPTITLTLEDAERVLGLGKYCPECQGTGEKFGGFPCYHWSER